MVLNGTVRQAFFHPPQQPELLIVFIRAAAAIIVMRLSQPNAIRLETEMPSSEDADVLDPEPRVINSDLAYRDQALINLLCNDPLNILAAMSIVDKPIDFNDDPITRLKNVSEQGQARSLGTDPVVDARTA